jgi:enolase
MAATQLAASQLAKGRSETQLEPKALSHLAVAPMLIHIKMSVLTRAHQLKVLNSRARFRKTMEKQRFQAVFQDTEMTYYVHPVVPSYC